MAYDAQIGAATIFCEASGEPEIAQRGVAWVIVNRMRDGRWGKSVAEVCLERKQFSEWNDDKCNNENLLRFARTLDSDAVLHSCEAALLVALGGSVENDPTQGATHYHDVSIDTPFWALTATFTVQLGKLRFFKGVK